MAYQVRPLRDGLGFGKEVLGLASDDIADDEVCADLRRHWVQDGLLVFRGSEVTPEFQIALSTVFGELERHPVPELRDKIYPDLMTLVSDQKKEGLYDVDGVPSIAFLPWHSDLVFTDHINHGGLLTAVQISSWGGQTGFCDQIRAYDTLPEDLKEEIEGLEIAYQLVVNPSHGRYGTRSNVKTLRVSEFEKKLTARRDNDYPAVAHPIVFVQPDTGRKVLNVSPLGAMHIVGRDTPAGHALLRRLVDHLEASPAYFHSWQPSEMLLWDNWRMIHCVTGAPPEEVRIVQRTTIKGDYGLGRKLEIVSHSVV